MVLPVAMRFRRPGIDFTSCLTTEVGVRPPRSRTVRRQHLWDDPHFTSYTRDGGFATAVIADARFAFPLGKTGADADLAPCFVPV